MLQRHTQNMSSARERLEQELALEERRTLALQQQLQAVRQALTASFASLPVPGAEAPTPTPRGPVPANPAPLNPHPGHHESCPWSLRRLAQTLEIAPTPLTPSLPQALHAPATPHPHPPYRLPAAPVSAAVPPLVIVFGRF